MKRTLIPMLVGALLLTTFTPTADATASAAVVCAYSGSDPRDCVRVAITSEIFCRDDATYGAWTCAYIYDVRLDVPDDVCIQFSFVGRGLSTCAIGDETILRTYVEDGYTHSGDAWFGFHSNDAAAAELKMTSPAGEEVASWWHFNAPLIGPPEDATAGVRAAAHFYNRQPQNFWYGDNIFSPSPPRPVAYAG